MSENLRLVLVSCCAPCSAGAIKQLADGEISGVVDFVVMFFNPNIYPMEEYKKRMLEQIKYCEKLGVKYVIGEYNHEAWRSAVAGLESEPERGKRCGICFAYRFEYAKKWAIDNGYNAICSVLGVSRHKNQSQVDESAQSVCDNNVCYVPIKWNENLRQQIGHKADFYRQNYCGCEFSIRKI